MGKLISKMKVAIALFLFALVLCVRGGQECGETVCGKGECCSGNDYARHCRALAKDGEPCEPRNSFGSFKTACACEEGLICSVIRRCQTPY